MTRFDTLRLLLAAEVADDLPSVEATMTEISRRMDTLDRDSDAYAAAHCRLNELIGQRDRLRSDTVTVSRLALAACLEAALHNPYLGDEPGDLAWIAVIESAVGDADSGVSS